MDLYRLAYWLEDLTPSITELEGFLFIDRLGRGSESLSAEAKKFTSLEDAQQWMNIVLIDGFVTEIVGPDWDSKDPSVLKILSIFQDAWSCRVRANYPNTKFFVEVLVDEDSGDVGLRLRNEAAC